MNYREDMVRVIKQHWYYADGVLEGSTDEEVKDIYERLIDWLN